MSGRPPGTEPQPAEVSEQLKAKNREVQRLLGRCMIRIQQIERLLKAVVCGHHVFGSGVDSARLAERRASQVAKLGTGELVDLVLSGYFQVRTGEIGQDGQEIEQPARRKASNPQSRTAGLSKHYNKARADALEQRRPWFDTKLTVSIDQQEAKAITRRLTSFVQLRNRVVHRFCEEHEIHTEAGCERAATALETIDADLAEHIEDLRQWAVQLDELRGEWARLMSDPAMLDKLLGLPVGEEGSPEGP